MKLLDSGVRMLAMAHGTAVRWLKDELLARQVKIPLSEGSLEELVREADVAACAALQEAGAGAHYLEQLRQQLVRQADLVQRWTGSDEKFDTNDAAASAFVRIARSYALPRPWKLSEPVAVESRKLRPSHWKWASRSQARSVA